MLSGLVPGFPVVVKAGWVSLFVVGLTSETLGEACFSGAAAVDERWLTW